jgi:hypothetical protein
MREYEVADTVEYKDIFGQRSCAVVRAKRRELKHDRAGFEGVGVGTGDPVWGYDDQIAYVVPANAIYVEWPDEASAEDGNEGSTEGPIEMCSGLSPRVAKDRPGLRSHGSMRTAGSGRSSASTGLRD